MTDDNEPIRIEDDDARGAHTTKTMRYVLGFGLVLAVVAMSLIWIIPSLYG